MISRHPKRLTHHLAAFFSDSYPSNGKPPQMKPFNPVEHGLKPDFVLTNYTKMKG